MAFAIPKLQYLNGTSTADTTSGDEVISSVADTTDVEIGMVITGAGIPTGTTVLSKTADTITMSADATATAVAIAIAFSHQIEFDYPPKEKAGEKLKSSSTISTSLSGIQQVATNHIEGTRKVIFSFLSPTKYLLVKTFIEEHGIYGRAFRYFENKTVDSYVEYELEKLDVEPKKIAPKGEDIYTWEIPLEFRRVL